MHRGEVVQRLDDVFILDVISLLLAIVFSHPDSITVFCPYMYTINSKLTYIFRNLPRVWILEVLLASLIWFSLAVRGGPLFPGYTCSASVISSPGSH